MLIYTGDHLGYLKLVNTESKLVCPLDQTQTRIAKPHRSLGITAVIWGDDTESVLFVTRRLGILEVIDIKEKSAERPKVFAIPPEPRFIKRVPGWGTLILSKNGDVVLFNTEEILKLAKHRADTRVGDIDHVAELEAEDERDWRFGIGAETYYGRRSSVHEQQVDSEESIVPRHDVVDPLLLFSRLHTDVTCAHHFNDEEGVHTLALGGSWAGMRVVALRGGAWVPVWKESLSHPVFGHRVCGQLMTMGALDKESALIYGIDNSGHMSVYQRNLTEYWTFFKCQATQPGRSAIHSILLSSNDDGLWRNGSVKVKEQKWEESESGGEAESPAEALDDASPSAMEVAGTGLQDESAQSSSSSEEEERRSTAANSPTPQGLKRPSRTAGTHQEYHILVGDNRGGAFVVRIQFKPETEEIVQARLRRLQLRELRDLYSSTVHKDALKAHPKYKLGEIFHVVDDSLVDIVNVAVINGFPGIIGCIQASYVSLKGGYAVFGGMGRRLFVYTREGCKRWALQHRVNLKQQITALIMPKGNT